MDNKNFKRPKPVVLCVLDGIGIAQSYSGNAFSQAKLPNLNNFISKYPITALSASGEAVGLPWGEMGNSEVGHLNLGAGRIVYQDLPRINKAISDNSFFKNKALLGAVQHAQKNKSSLNFMGLLSNGGVHAAIEHIIALLALAEQNKLEKVYLHLFLDGRDMPYNSGRQIIKDIKNRIAEYKTGEIATLSGRFYAMDRDNNWDRVEKSYLAMTAGVCRDSFASAEEAIDFYYNKKIYDEEFYPTVLTKGGKPVSLIKDKDAVIFFNFRSDRARQMTKAFILPGFNKFKREVEYRNLYFVTMTEYEKNLPVEVAFPPEEIKNALGQVIADQGLRQLRIAETEKYAHVTYFFNGGREEVYRKEDREVVPSPRIESYADEPKMSAPEVTSRLIKEINKDAYDFILVNYANGDMVGHTGNIDATIAALEYLDKAVGELVQLILAKNGVMLITSDHGNCEEMFNMQTGSIDKEHTTNPVPLVIISNELEGKSLSEGDIAGNDLSVLNARGILADVAPTILKIMGIEKPREMTGRTLI
ncbi:2,3-bisphosphoglycerate-independent phosphoglycerate mutase [Candidatus Falkowbacteria bacterium CG10_big_fil_rev_8_21_14_0_10_43_10]|uniref:2,3-bisphosphoglycerate-independent phosphoglycerate mutase n=1 Tax=Candidatus Falkowbacteria bacterium CG10_big_fil_rev_8_21_14_0_10_43_10 TaxID=1974567 RepID=A0A2H0V2C3_9BACT|nr:MAG: 2,3-bisphosphoglycerate-independent phosphoglycerate mutase [Candidatus Falkowbacteria bacterium CG10_big_fil_rev_8_21_14_0_10_43_10]